MTYQSPEQSQEKRRARMATAALQFTQAEAEAREGGLVLIRRTDVHYQLSSGDGGWLLNIYPSNRRLYHDTNRPRGPYLHVRGDWSLLDVVQAAVLQTQRGVR